MSDKHTPLPWTYKSNGHYFDIGVECDEGSRLGIYPLAAIGVRHADEANAKLIVTAVNNHDRLVEALRMVVGVFEEAPYVPKEVVMAEQFLTELEKER